MAGQSREDALVIAGTEVAPASRRAFEIPVARLPTGTMVHLPVVAVCGGRPGPRLWLSGAIHGDELNGVEVIRRVVAELDPAELSGAVIAVPVVNVFGFIEQSRYLPDRRDLNRSFPGSPKGSLAGQLAHLFVREVVSRCDYGVDLHTGSHHRTNLPQIRADLDDERTREFARAFAAPISVHARVRDGSLREAAAAAGIPVLVYEAGEAHRFSRRAIDTGVRGVRRVLAYLGMAAPEDETPPPVPPESRSTRWVRAGRSGLWRLSVELGAKVAAGDVLGGIGELLGTTSRPVKAPLAGVVIGASTHPLVSRGDALVHIAAL